MAVRLLISLICAASSSFLLQSSSVLALSPASLILHTQRHRISSFSVFFFSSNILLYSPILSVNILISLICSSYLSMSVFRFDSSVSFSFISKSVFAIWESSSLPLRILLLYDFSIIPSIKRSSMTFLVVL